MLSDPHEAILVMMVIAAILLGLALTFPLETYWGSDSELYSGSGIRFTPGPPAKFRFSLLRGELNNYEHNKLLVDPSG